MNVLFVVVVCKEKKVEKHWATQVSHHRKQCFLITDFVEYVFIK
jgi:hypothetical protein